MPRTVASDEPAGPLFGLPARQLRANEVVLHHWPSPHGRGLLTDQRLLELSHPEPLHRRVLWSQNLEDVNALGVTEGPGRQVTTFRIAGPRASTQGSAVGSPVTPERLDPDFYVKVNDVVVYKGYPETCAEIQRRIDGAREQRMMAVLGHVVPYRESG